MDNNPSNKLDACDRKKYNNCCICSRLFYAQVRNSFINGRVPLILPCAHLICEECAHHMSKQKSVTCNVCKNVTDLNDVIKSMRDIFPVDRYMLGNLVKHSVMERNVRVLDVERPGMQSSHFQPAGSAIQSSQRNAKQGQNARMVINSNIVEPTRTMITHCTEYPQCEEEAVWRCIDCNDVYCDGCNIKVHTAARAFGKHVRIPVGSLSMSDFSIYCAQHRGTHPDYCCVVCDLFLCWKCMIKDHQGHEVRSIRDKNQSDLPEMNENLLEAEKMLNRLQYEQQRVHTEILFNRKNPKTSPVEINIMKHFANLHARLQLLQNKVMEDFVQAQNTNFDNLQNMYSELNTTKTDLSTLISICHIVDQSDDYLDKVIVKEIINKLKEMLRMPCLLQGKADENCTEFVASDDFILELEKHCSIQLRESINPYKLVSLSSFPSGVDLMPTEEQMSSLIVETKSRTSSISSERSFDSKAESMSSRMALSFAGTSKNINNNINLKSKETKSEDMCLKEGSSETIIVTHLVDPILFFVQLTKMSKNIETLNKKLMQYAMYAPIPDSPVLNQTYLVLYTNKHFKRWYRGTITGIIEQDEPLYEVFYIDYGNTSLVPKSLLRELSQIFMKDKPYAYKCKIYNLFPSTEKSNSEVIQFMVEFITGSEPTDDADMEYLLHSEQSSKQMQMLVFENVNNILSVDLLHNDLSSLKYALMFVGCAQKPSEDDMPYNATPKLLTSMKKIHTMMDNFKKNQICYVNVSSVIDPNHFYVQISNYKNTVDDLSHKMNKYYKKNFKKDMIYGPKEGMICAALLSNNYWRRAEITNLPGNARVEIFTLDFGNTHVVPWNKIRKLHNDFVAFDAQAVRVNLVDITPVNKGNWTSDACNYFMNYTNDKVLKMNVQHPAITELDIILFEEKEDIDICINALLVREKYAISKGESSMVVEHHKIVPIDEKNLIKYNTCHNEFRSPLLMSKNNKCGNNLKNATSQFELPSTIKEPAFQKTVALVHIESPDCFYVTLPEWIPLRNKLMKDMKQFYSSTNSSKINWKVNDKCAVLSIKGNAWYRGIIIDTNKKYTVFLKDIALIEDLPANNIYPLDDQFLGVRDLAIRCSLAGIIPAGGSVKWTHLAIEKFQELANVHRDLYITKQGDIVNKSLPVHFYATWEEIGGPLEPSTQRHSLLNKCLIDQGVALPAKGISFNEYSEKNPFENDPFESSSTLIASTTELVDKIPDHWLTALPLNENLFRGKVTYVDHDGYVYLHSLQMENNLLQMKRLLNNNFLKTSPDPEHPWFPGQMCTVQYYLDKTYYRATILDTKNDGQILVQFIDYGNEEEIPHTEIRSDVMLIEEPAMATKCKLFNVEPLTSNGKWPIPLLDKLHATIVDQEVDVEVIGKQIDNEPVNVILTFNKVNINLQVMSADWCKEEQEKIKGYTLIEDEDCDVIIEGSINESDTSDDKIGDWVSMANLEQLNEVKYQYIDLPKNSKTFEAVVINVLEFNTLIIEGSFNIHLIKSTEEQFDKLSKVMNENGPKQPPVFEPTIGQACCTEYSEDKNWYRAEIYSIDMLDKTGRVEVLFVDYGNLELVPRENIRMLRKEWAEFPVQQLKCRIFGIEKGDEIESQEACKYMSDSLLEKRLLLIVKKTEPVLEASFLDLDSTNLAYKQAIDDGILILN